MIFYHFLDSNMYEGLKLTKAGWFVLVRYRDWRLEIVSEPL